MDWMLVEMRSNRLSVDGRRNSTFRGISLERAELVCTGQPRQDAGYRSATGGQADLAANAVRERELYLDQRSRRKNHSPPGNARSHHPTPLRKQLDVGNLRRRLHSPGRGHMYRITPFLPSLAPIVLPRQTARRRLDPESPTCPSLHRRESRLIGAAFALLLSYWMARSISSPIEQAATQLVQLTDQTSLAVEQLAGASQSAAEALSRQASSLEQPSATLEELTAATKRDLAGAQQIQELVNQVRVVVAKGDQHVNQMATAPKEILGSANQVRKIVHTIEENRVSDQHSRAKRSSGGGACG